MFGYDDIRWAAHGVLDPKAATDTLGETGLACPQAADQKKDIAWLRKFAQAELLLLPSTGRN